jgi:hypothetical protein
VLDFDAAEERTTAMAFDARLFMQATLCYSGSFAMARSMAVGADGDDREVRNTGPNAWPAGRFVDQGRVHELAPQAAGASTTLASGIGRPAADGAERTAVARVPPVAAAVLWPLDLRGVAALPQRAEGWLLLSAEPGP